MNIGGTILNIIMQAAEIWFGWGATMTKMGKTALSTMTVKPKEIVMANLPLAKNTIRRTDQKGEFAPGHKKRFSAICIYCGHNMHIATQYGIYKLRFNLPNIFPKKICNF